MDTNRSIAYFSMEFGLDPGMPTYSGGLGILAGDTARAAADLRIAMVGVTLLHRKGYFFQRLDSEGRQTEEPCAWSIGEFLAPIAAEVAVEIEGRKVRVGAWKYDIRGCGGYSVPVLFLDTDVEGNADWDRQLTHSLYGGDLHYRFCQEVVLGIGGVRMLRKLEFTDVKRFHLNEGHASLLTLELLRERAEPANRPINHDDIDAVRQLCAFTTHTPVPSGHDKFPLEIVERVLGSRDEFKMKDVFCCDGVVNMTHLALNLSHYVNGVAKRHGDITKQMFAQYQIDSITNGIHSATWASPYIQRLLDQHIPGWREDNFSLRYGISLPSDELWAAHAASKQALIQFLNHTNNAGMEADRLTIGFARRATAYKRLNLLFHDTERLRRISREVGRIQIVYGGKAHPRDESGKELIRQVFAARKALGNDVRVVYVENYDMTAAQLMVSGVDVWLNTPEPPMEASGTSGMKAAINGVPSLSILDGWWIEGCIEGITGWAIGDDHNGRSVGDDGSQDARSLYDKLEHMIVPLFYRQRERFIDVMRHALALNGSFFNTQRMIQQYVTRAYST